MSCSSYFSALLTHNVRPGLAATVLYLNGMEVARAENGAARRRTFIYPLGTETAAIRNVPLPHPRPTLASQVDIALQSFRRYPSVAGDHSKLLILRGGVSETYLNGQPVTPGAPVVLDEIEPALLQFLSLALEADEETAKRAGGAA